MPVEPPTPSAEQLADWQALVERIRQGDRAQVLAWDEGAAARPAATYQVLVTQQVTGGSDAPPLLAGSVAGIVAVLRVDPTEASMIFRRRRLGDGGWTVLRHRRRVADLLGPAARADGGAARPDLDGMTSNRWHASCRCEGSTGRSSGRPASSGCHPSCCCCGCGQPVDQSFSGLGPSGEASTESSGRVLVRIRHNLAAVSGRD